MSEVGWQVSGHLFGERGYEPRFDFRNTEIFDTEAGFDDLRGSFFPSFGDPRFLKLFVNRGLSRFEVA